jgi:hypothetical protein
LTSLKFQIFDQFFFKFKEEGKIFFLLLLLSLSLLSLSLSLETAPSSLDVHDVHFSLVTAVAALLLLLLQILVLLLQGKKITSSQNQTNVVRTLLFLNDSRHQ